jgi:hypothetical protein
LAFCSENAGVGKQRRRWRGGLNISRHSEVCPGMSRSRG